jgi:FKBP-type peptidyl-prolyl cis-trans isomerase
MVNVHYVGRLIDGTKFDSSYDRGTPSSFPLNRVIPGWSQGIQLMSVGSIFEIYIPGMLAYAQNEGPGGPGATLIFEVELLGIARNTENKSPN